MRSLQMQMNDLLKEYGDAIIDKIDDILPGVGERAAKQLQQTSPQRTGNYAKGWKVSKKTRSGSFTEVRVYNEKFYRLTHLLEYGHASRNGGRVKAQPHIIWVEESASEELMNSIMDAVESIT